MLVNKKKRPAPTSAALTSVADEDEFNRLLFAWLSDDEDRATLYHLVNDHCRGRLDFWSRDASPRECDCEGVDRPRPVQPNFRHKKVTLITGRDQIVEVLENAHSHYSSRIYAELGGGSFMLALDPGATRPLHALQKSAFTACFPGNALQLAELSHTACTAASIMSLRAPEFDLAEFAEQAALRFCQNLLGYSLTDYRLLQTTLGAAYRALVYQVLGRHFVTDPVTIPTAKAAMGRLLARTSELIDAYEANDVDALKGCEYKNARPAGFEPVLKKLGEWRSDMNGEQRAIVAMGAAIGTVGNVQAAACIAVKALFASPVLWKQARRLATAESHARPTQNTAGWIGCIQDALRVNPPIPFLPRLKVDAQGVSEGEVILALGGGTQSGPAGNDPLIWGLPASGPHWCAGMGLAWPLIVEIVRSVIALPGLAERLDARDASVIGLKKRWGFACESYPLTHRRDERVMQSTLNVAMRLRPPVKDSAERVREVIRSGAPRIESALREARHVHFAWFELIESDTVLVLHTVYDGPFDAYIQHFALKVGVVFDALFECIENPPPMPVDEFPNEFVAHIRRHDRAPAMGYFFSAYPRRDVARIIRDEWARP